MLERTYQPAEIEAHIHAAWMRADAFRSGRADRVACPPYAIVIPPPNVTGSLHMGHALNTTLQDVLCRFERMRGRDVLWQPGTDHAGIATQLVVERQMMERQEPDRRSIGREQFVQKVWQWKAESGGSIITQLMRLGASCDWARERFTMDEGLSRAVLKAFVDLYHAGLIYKDKRLVNWDPSFQSAISDLEVDMVEVRGSLWHFRYPLAAPVAGYESDHIIVATTRPETMLGDTAVAVHPEDPRYAALAARFASGDPAMVRLPLVGRLIPVIADAYSDPEKGSGAVKITPAHDFNDFEVGRRHSLPVINVLDAHARIISAAGEPHLEEVPAELRRLDRVAARKRIVEMMDALGLVAKVEAHTHAVPHAQRGAAVVEPWLTDQWYVDAQRLAPEAIAVVASGKTRFVPKSWEKTYFDWMRNIRPWCISRQLWWGHQIPAWYGLAAGSGAGGGEDAATKTQIFVAHGEAEALQQARRYYASDAVAVVADAAAARALCAAAGAAPAHGIWRDVDVLDTWFSSALWPFSTLGWPESTKELARYYPTSVLVTAFDIIFFWVARMLMLATHFMREVPFRDVYIHALVLDPRGQKMSKTKGNVVDPLDIIDRFGADSLRFTLAVMAAQGRNIRLSEQRVEGYRNFATKLWNAARFAAMNACIPVEDFDPRMARGTLNRWIAGEVERCTAAVTAGIEGYKFNEAASAIYEFVWASFCDWYLELAKPILGGDDEQAKAETRAMTAWVLEHILKLLHPFMPFVTEALWERLAAPKGERRGLLCLSPWPRLEGLADRRADEEIGWLVKLVSEVRSVRSEMNVPAGALVPLFFVGAGSLARARAAQHEETIKRLARINEVSFAAAPRGSAQIVLEDTTAALPLGGVIDMDKERTRLAREIDQCLAEIKKIDGRLANHEFLAKAPPAVVEEARERRVDFAATIDKLKAALRRVDAAA
jgi:valyl-tRNA synthetase